MSSSVQQIKDRLNLVEFIGQYVKLESAGLNFRGKCPFHNEKTPSFFVSPARGTYHCFGCNKGGDIFSFIQDMEGLDFKEALSLLADRAGVKLEPKFNSLNQLDRSITDLLKSIMISATDFYHQTLLQDQTALNYLLERGLSLETIKFFKLGLAPADWRPLHDQLLKLNFKVETMVRAGLVIEAKKNSQRSVFYDRFRSRIMFPLNNDHGQVVAFSGRVIGPLSDDNKVAKYINSPQTDLYDKSRLLYAYDRAKETIRRETTAILVEGQMDVVMSHQSGLTNAVAVSGTALTSLHLTLLRRLAETIVMAFDADEAGYKAGKRAVGLAFEAGFEVKVVVLPEGTDPADLAKSEPKELIKTMNQPVDVIGYYLNQLEKKAKTQRELSKLVRAEIYPLLQSQKSVTSQAHYIKMISEATDLTETIVWQDFQDFLQTQSLNVKKELGPEVLVKSKFSQVERGWAHLFGLLYLEADGKSILDLDSVKRLIEKLGLDVVTKQEEIFSERKEELIFEAEVLYGDDFKIRSKHVEALINDLIKLYWQDKLKQTMQNLKQAERNQDKILIDKYLKLCQDISQSLNQSLN